MKSIETVRSIQAVVVAGSVARNFADAYSDVEIPIFWESLPDDETRHAIVNSLDAEFIVSYNGPAREDQLLIKGLQVDLWHITVRREEETIHSVLDEHQVDLSRLNAMDTIRCCIPLFGDEIIAKWKDRAKEYPEELREAIVKAHLDSFAIGQLGLAAKRNDPTGFYAELTRLQQEVFLILLALNKCYFPTFKWLYQTMKAMAIKPISIEQRFKRAYTLSFMDAIEDTKKVLEETLQLVWEQQLLADKESAYQYLSYVRTATEKPISA